MDLDECSGSTGAKGGKLMRQAGHLAPNDDASIIVRPSLLLHSTLSITDVDPISVRGKGEMEKREKMINCTRIVARLLGTVEGLSGEVGRYFSLNVE